MMRKTQQLFNATMQVSYLEAGQGIPLLLIHGVGMNAESWEPQIEVLQQYFRVIAVDMPGHGQSDGFNHKVTLQDYVNWAAAFLHTQPELNFAVAGHSMGALISAGLAIDYPDLVHHCIVISGVYRRDEAARAAVLQRADELARGNACLDSPLTRWFSDLPEETEIRKRVSGWLNGVNVQGYITAYQVFASDDTAYVGRWGEIHCPVLVLTGELDTNSSPVMAQQMADAAPQGKAVIISKAKHMVGLTDAFRVNEEILRFLRQIKQHAAPCQYDTAGGTNGDR